MSNTD